MERSFTIAPRVIAHLGEDLIKNESIALLELVKNAYDANASICRVDFFFDGDKLERLTISDDGSGMDMETVLNVWLTIGTDNKKRILASYKGDRLPLGEKGIGRLGIHKLGRLIKMTTRQVNQNEVEVDIDWRQLKESSSIDDFMVKVNEVLVQPTITTHGTIIQISDLKGTWDTRTLRAVYRDLCSLNSPFAKKNDSFQVEITTNTTVFAGLPKPDEMLNVAMYRAHCIIEGNAITEFKYEFCPWPQLTKVQPRTVNELNEEEKTLLRKQDVESSRYSKKSEIVPFSLSSYAIGSVELELAIFEKDASIFGLMNMERTSLNSYLKENGGVRVYRDGVRVYNYGEKDNDWLSLDYRRIVRAGGNINNNSVIGAVSLSRKDSTDLKEKTNREGFIENEAYFAFVDAVSYAIDLVNKQRIYDKERLISIYKDNKRIVEPVVSDLNEALQLVEERVSNPKDKEAIISCLVRVNKQYQEVRDVLIRSANAGLNLGAVIHDIDKQVSALLGCAERGEINRIRDIAENLEKIISGYTVLLTNSSIKETDVAQIVGLVLETNQFRFMDHKIRVFSNRKSVSLRAFLSKAETVASLTNLLDNSIYWVSKSRTDDRMIYVFITDQIQGFVSVVICDNGTGFSIPPDIAVRPFVSGKPLGTGMGLGLHITNEVMIAMNGQLLVLNENEIDLPSTAKDKGINKAIVALCFPKVKK